MTCPWSSFDQTTLEFCEENLCAWIKEPVNTVSNLAYIAVGIAIYLRATRERRPLLRWLGVVSILTGVGSAFYHASGIHIAGIADYLGMFLGTGAMTALNVKRWLGWKVRALYMVFIGTTLALIVLSQLAPGSERWIYILAMPCCLIEAVLFFRDRFKTSYRDYLIAWIFVLLGFFIWWLDISKVVCDPENHWMQGHALWHILTAIAFYFFFRFYLQFPKVRT